MKRITIKDIARELGLSASTVSRALKDHPDISTETISKVKDLAKALQYRPNDFAINFRNKKSHTIGLIVPQVSDIYFPSVLKGVDEILKKANYNLLILPSNESLEKEKNNLEICERNNVDGLLISITKETADMEHFQSLLDYRIPMVFIDRVPNQKDLHRVVVNDQKAAFQATSILLERGARRILGLFGNENLNITKNRLNGFRQACHFFKLPESGYRTHYCENRAEARQLTGEALKERNRPDSIFSMSDEILLGVMSAVYESDVKIPEEVSVICISDGEFPEFFNPRISYVQTSGYKIGKAAAMHLLRLINEEELTSRKLIIDTPYVSKASVR